MTKTEAKAVVRGLVDESVRTDSVVSESVCPEVLEAATQITREHFDAIEHAIAEEGLK